MDRYYIAVAAILLTTILSVALHRHNGEIAALLGLCGSCLVAMVAVGFLAPVTDFLRQLQQIGSVAPQMFGIMMKVTAVSFTAEIAATVCSDSGNSALGKSLQILSTAVILYLSLPMFQALLDLVERILGGI